MRLTPRFGYRLVIETLLIRVQIRPEGWCYHLSQVRTLRVIKNWTACFPQGTAGDAEKARLEAIQAALGELSCDDDPRGFLNSPDWATVSNRGYVDDLRDEKELRLYKDYRAAARHFSWAVDQLASRCGSTRAFTKALKAVDEAQINCEKARQAIDKFRKSAKRT